MRSAKIFYQKVLQVKDPDFATEGSAGIDFYCPENTPEFLSMLREKNNLVGDSSAKMILYPEEKNGNYGIYIQPSASVIIPSGIVVGLDPNYVLVAFNKSGISAKKGLVLGACVVDSDYSGIVFINLINTSDTLQRIEFGQKLTQFLLLPCPSVVLEPVTEDFMNRFHSHSSRKDGALGCSDNKKGVSSTYRSMGSSLCSSNYLDFFDYIEDSTSVSLPNAEYYYFTSLIDNNDDT